MTTPSSGPGSGHCSTHSNPNITRLPHSSSGNGMIARSTSHPPEMFCWNEPVTPHHLISYVDREIQTDFDIIHNFIVENPRRVLQILGLDPDVIFTTFKKQDSITNVREDDNNGGLSEKRNEWKSSSPFFYIETTDKTNRKNSTNLYEAINQNVDTNTLSRGKLNEHQDV